MVGRFDPCLSLFFLFFLFFFFLFTRLLGLELSLDEEDGTEGNLASEEGEEDLTGEDGEGSVSDQNALVLFKEFLSLSLSFSFLAFGKCLKILVSLSH